MPLSPSEVVLCPGNLVQLVIKLILFISMAEKAEKGQTFTSFVSETLMITLNKLMGSDNYLS